MPDRLFAKIHGCDAAVNISNSMGDVTEGKSFQVIAERYGLVDSLLPQDKGHHVRKRDWGPDQIRHPHHRPPGMTEDGIERHRLMCTAIIEKGGRIDIWDLARTWRRDIDPAHFGYLLGNQDRIFYDLFAAGFPPTESGRYADWPGFIGTAKMMLPVGLVNACNPAQAARDALSLGRIKDRAGSPRNFALEVCAAIAAGCAEAMKPGATIDSIIAEALRHLSSSPLAEVERGLDWASQLGSVWDLRPLFADAYRGQPPSNAVEVLAAGLSIFRLVGESTREATLAAVNFGRDCDCISYVAVGLAGALNGIESVPSDWVRIVEEELPSDPYTVSRRSLQDTALGLQQAALNELARTRQRLNEMLPYALGVEE